jgi:hypothetical protein
MPAGQFPMGVPGTGGEPFLLFVGGEPGPGPESMRDVETSMGRRMLGSVVGNWWTPRVPGPSQSGVAAQAPLPDDLPWHLPPPQIQAANMVFEIADRFGRKVAVVDVNRPGQNQGLVDRWVGTSGILPLLVRSDGGRLEGIEEFVPKKVRRFIGAP